MKLLAIALALALQATPAAPLVSVRATLQRLGPDLDQHRPTYGATDQMTVAKHGLREWIESQLATFPQTGDTRTFADTLHATIKGADLLCDECDWNFLGYIDDVRVTRVGDLLAVVTATGISCGYDESTYVYAWRNGWVRVWEHEENTYTMEGYRPQTVYDIQATEPDANGSRLLLTLGSQTICGGAFKNIYTRVWRLDADGRSEKLLDHSERANDDSPPIEGRLRPGEVVVKFSAGGFLDGDPHQAIRHFAIDRTSATRIDPIAGRPRDFVAEWLLAPWSESRTRAESPALEAAHAELSRTDGAGDFPGPTLKCTGDADAWQVFTNLYERPKRYFRVRWRAPFTFTVIGVSESAYPDCTVKDERGEAFADVLNLSLR